MADNNMDAAGQRGSPQAAKRIRLDTDHEDCTSAPLSSLDAEMFVEPSHPSQVLEGLNRLRLNNSLCDVTLCCEGQEVSCHRYVLASFSPYFEEEFLSLPVDRVSEVLSSDHLNVPKEDMVFDAAMLWLDKNPTHKNNFEKVLEQIRLPLISPSHLLSVVERLEVVKDQQGCQRFISEAKGEQPYSNTAGPRSTTVIMTVGREDLQSFDPLTNQWRILGRMPLKLGAYAVVSSGSSLYLAGGHHNYGASGGTNVGYSREMWRYDVQHNSWLKMAPMNEPRAVTYDDFSLVMLDGYVFAVGGREVFLGPQSMERYDPITDTWQVMEGVRLEEHHVGRCNVVALDGELYCIGSDSTESRMVKYNPKTSVWTEVAPMQIPRFKTAPCVLNGKIYVTGGLYSNGTNRTVKNTMECYNTKANQWTMCAPMQVERCRHSVAVVDGKIYVLGGLRQGDSLTPVCNIECYCEETDTWETVGETPAALSYGHNCGSVRLRRDHGRPIDDEDNDPEDD